MSQNNSTKTLSGLFRDDCYDYIYIPRIQRDYAQGRNNEEARVIRDNILDDVSTGRPLSWGIVFGVSENKMTEDGSNKKCFIPIDGQQRLTTLYLLNLYGAKRHKIDFDYLQNFNYETRNASKDFIEGLVKNWHGDKKGLSLKEHIINQGWFLNYWLLDPTVDAVLNMLTSIDNRFVNRKDVFENLDRISFEFLDLKSLDLNETLYLKMNSRGRKLSQFDKIKSEIDKLLSKVNVGITSCNFDIYPDAHLNSLGCFQDRWRYCIDRKWSDLFWDKTTHTFDTRFLAFMVNYLAAIADKDYEYVDNLLNINFGDPNFFLPWKYLSTFLNTDNNADIYLKNISSILNKLVYNVERSHIVHDLIKLPNSYQERARLFGLLSFLGNDYNTDAFKEWERFVYNYAVNTVEDKETFYAFAKRIKEEFSWYSMDILSYLSSKYDNSKYDREQLNEEYFKASIILKGGELEREIRLAEKHPLLNGRIRPLIVDNNHYDSISFIKIWKNFLEWFGLDGKKLQFKEGDSASLLRRTVFATAFTQSITQMNQLFSDIKCLDFSGNTLKDKLHMQRFELIFRRCLLCEDLTGIGELCWSNSEDMEGIQTKSALLQNGVIEGILKHKGGEELRFRWYHNCSCFYPNNGRTNDWRIGFDRINEDPGWTRNRNHVLNFLEKRGYEIKETRVSNDNTIALWWGSDIMFINLKFPDIYLMWDAYYNIGIIHKNNRTWVKRQSRKEGQNENYLFRAVEKNTEQIEQEINRLISEYLDDTSKQITE
ncbi:MAG: DUF262 domain-containing protein [Bacteroidales bacterium]|nr:DUF262 domain-containing protein [Bacteroidales bacterium]